MLSNKFELANIVGSFYYDGYLEFHPQKLQLFSPIQNNILHIDIENSTSSILNFQTQGGNVQIIKICNEGQLLVISDSLNRVYLYNIETNMKIGQKSFKSKISDIIFSHNNTLFFIVCGKFVYIYEKPSNIYNVLLEPFFMVRQYNSKSSNHIPYMQLSQNQSTTMLLANDDNIIRIVPTFPNNKFNNVYELKGHKNQIVGMIDYLNTKDKLVSFDKNGIVLCWQIVQKDDDQSQESHEDTHVQSNKNLVQKQQEKKDVVITKFEQKLLDSKFILERKELFYQENSSINNLLIQQDIVLVSFLNKIFGLYEVKIDDQQQIMHNLFNFRLTQDVPSSMIFHPYKPIIAAGIQNNGQLIVWNWRSKQYILQQSTSDAIISHYQFNEDCTYLAIADYKGQVKIYDTQNFFNPITFTEAVAKITGIKFINKKTLACSSLDGTIRLYDLNKYKCFRELSTETSNQIQCLEVEKEGEIVFGGGFDPYAIYIWSYRTGKIIDVIEGHNAPIIHLQFSNIEQSLISASWDNTIRITKVFSKTQNMEEIQVGQKIMCLKMANNEKLFAICTYTNEIQVFQIQNSQMIALIDTNPQFSKQNINSIDFTTDCKKLVAISNTQNRVYTYDIQHRTVIDSFEINFNIEYQNAKVKKNNKNIVDGYNVQELQQQDNDDNNLNNKNNIILPGSNTNTLNNTQKRQQDLLFDQIQFSPDNKYLSVIQNERLMLFKKDQKYTYIGFEKNITKGKLLELIQKQKYVEFSVICIKLQKYELLKTIFLHLRHNEIISILKLSEKQDLIILMQFLLQNIDSSNIEEYIVWIKYILFYRSEDLKIDDNSLSLLKRSLRELNVRFEDFAEHLICIRLNQFVGRKNQKGK